MRFSGIALTLACAGALQAGAAEAAPPTTAPGAKAAGAASGDPVFMPVAGDTFRYSLSNGERVTLEIVSVKPRDNQTVARVRESRILPGGESRNATFDLIRTPTSLAIDMPAPGDNARLSPLVYFFAPANPQDSWMAQHGTFLDGTGSPVRYQITAKLEAIETITAPAGTFEGCRRITYSSTLNDGMPAERVTRLTVWLHPDIGIVRSHSRTGEESRLTELVQYQKASQAIGRSR